MSNLNDEDRLVLSRLMDGEWADLNPSECVVGLCKDDALKSKWERYHLIRDVLRDEPVDVNSTLCSRISAAIADEPVYSNVTALSASSTSGDSISGGTQSQSIAAPIGAMPKWRTGLVGLGLAASVAVVTVVGMNNFQAGGTPLNDPITSAQSVTAEDAFSQQVQGVPLPEVEFVANTGSFWVSQDSDNQSQPSKRVAAEARLNMFLSQHIENSPTTVREGMLPYSRLVGYDEAVTSQPQR